MNDKEHILTTLRSEFNRWEALLTSLSEEQITAPLLPDNWSIKDVIIHLWAWQQRSIARLEAGLHNRTPAFPHWPAQFDPEQPDEPNQLNDWIYETYHDQPWSSIHRDWSAGYRRFLELAAAIPEPDLFDAQRYPWLEGHSLAFILQASYEHHQEHADYLEPVLAQLQRPATKPSAG